MLDKECDYGHSGSRIAACDKEAVETIDGENLCTEHASHARWALAHQDDEEPV